MKFLYFSFVLYFLSFAPCNADIFQVLDISKAGMNVQQQKLKAIAENVANVNTVKITGGGSYKQKKVIIKTDKRTGKPYVAKVEQRKAIVQKVHDPTNPEADENGYVYISNYSLSSELVDMSMVRRMYEANAAVFSSAKQMAQTIMNLGK